MNVKAMLLGGSLLLAASATAAEAGPVDGVFRGKYLCPQGSTQGVTGITLSIVSNSANKLTAVFNFYAPPENPRVATGTFDLTGTYTPATRRVVLKPSRWMAHPYGYIMVGVDATLSTDGRTLTGKILSTLKCTTITTTRLQPS
jgi:hypothetical protein